MPFPFLLTLQVPGRRKVVPLATSTSPAVIRTFCTAVVEEYCERETTATDELEAAVYRAELHRLRQVFSLIDPEKWGGGADHEAA